MDKDNKASGGWVDGRRGIPLENDLMFSTVMQRKDACMGLLDTIFDGHRVRDVEYREVPSPTAQKHMAFNPLNKGVRLDVYFEGSDGVYDVELQKVNMGNLPRRARMYSSMMDANMLDKGLDYEALKGSFVIFICMFDPFGMGLAKYTFQSMCREGWLLPLDDGRSIIFVNTRGSAGGSNADMDAFFRYLNGGVSSIGTGRDSGSEFVGRLDGYVLGINGDEEWRQGYMKYELNLIEKFKEGKVEGRTQGMAEGLSAGRIEGETNATNRMVKNLKEQGFPIEAIAKAANLSVEEVNGIN